MDHGDSLRATTARVAALAALVALSPAAMAWTHSAAQGAQDGPPDWWGHGSTAGIAVAIGWAVFKVVPPLVKLIVSWQAMLDQIMQRLEEDRSAAQKDRERLEEMHREAIESLRRPPTPPPG